jgi:hypothetical protein
MPAARASRSSFSRSLQLERLLQGPIEVLGVNSHLIARGVGGETLRRCRPPIKNVRAGLENVVGCVRLRYLASFLMAMDRHGGVDYSEPRVISQPTSRPSTPSGRDSRDPYTSAASSLHRGSQTVALRRGFLPLRLSWSFLRVYITARLPEVAPDNAKGRDVVAHVVLCVCGLRRKEHRVHFRFHRARQSYGGPTAGGAR